VKIGLIVSTVMFSCLCAAAPGHAAPRVSLTTLRASAHSVGQRLATRARDSRERLGAGTRALGSFARSGARAIQTSAPGRIVGSLRELRSLNKRIARSPAPVSPALLTARTRARASLRAARVETAADLKALGRGALESPLHLVEHLRNPKQLALAVGVTGGLGVASHLAGLSLMPVAEVLLPAVVAYRWYRALRGPIWEAQGPDRWREVGRESGSALMLGLELSGVHLLEHGHEMAGHAADAAHSLAGLARAFAAGVVALHDLFLLPMERGHHHDHANHDHRQPVSG